MKADIFRQAFDVLYTGVEVTDEDLERGYMYVVCPACEGSGEFEMPEGERVPCVECKTSGKWLVGTT